MNALMIEAMCALIGAMRLVVRNQLWFICILSNALGRRGVDARALWFEAEKVDTGLGELYGRLHKAKDRITDLNHNRPPSA